MPELDHRGPNVNDIDRAVRRPEVPEVLTRDRAAPVIGGMVARHVRRRGERFGERVLLRQRRIADGTEAEDDGPAGSSNPYW